MSKERTPLDGTTSSCIFGTGFEGTAIPIESVNTEGQSVIIEGILENLSRRELRETELIFFDLIDDETQSIFVKLFVRDKEECRHLCQVLKPGMRIRVKGTARFNDFGDEWMISAESIQEAPLALREDKAETKRVELHAHTQMSAMDSVVSVSKLIQTAARWGWDAVAITDHGVVQAFPEAMNTVADRELAIKVIYGMEGYLTDDDYKKPHADHVMMLAKNQAGLQNLYRLVTLSHLRYFHHQPRIPKRVLAEHREGLLLGAAACGEGELVRAVAAGKSEEELLAIAGFYDYLEIQPIENYAPLIRSGEYPGLRTDEDLRDINRKIAELAKKLGKLLVAAGNVHCLDPEDDIYRKILQTATSDEDAEHQPPFFLRTTEEMLEEFAYLGEELAYETVVTNPRRIADMIGRLKPIPDDLYLPKLPDSDNILKEMAYQRAHQWYGNNLPDIVKARLDWELDAIFRYEFSALYLIAQKLVKKSNEDGYLVGSRGSVGSSFVATMAGITEVNPLPPHYRCPKCKYSEFINDGSYGSGYDLPDKRCPNCGEPLTKDGHDIPVSVFLGFEGDKVPDIDLNFATDYQPVAHEYMKQLFGDDHVYRAGTVTTVWGKTAYQYARSYYEKKGEKKSDVFLRHIAKGCVGTKRATGKHPGGLMIVPQDMDVHCFTPLQHPDDRIDLEEVTTHFDYHAISGRIIKCDILGHDDPAMLKMLQDMTGFDPRTVPFDDPQTLSLFTSTEALGVSPKELGITTGTLGVPEFRTQFTQYMLNESKPTCFSELVKISGLSHGTSTWVGNADLLIRNGTCTLHDIVALRDDIMMYLIRKGVDTLPAFNVMESVRKGKGIRPDIVEQLRNAGVPEWYIKSCQKIQYLFPRAHAVAYVMMSFRIAYYKVHYPEAFYATYFAFHAKKQDADIIKEGSEAVRKKLQELKDLDQIDASQKDMLTVLQVAQEMLLRGYNVSPTCKD